MDFVLILFGLGFLAAMAGGVMTNTVPLAVGAIYAGASLLTFILYGWDKFRARRSQRRTPEETLHLLELLGGWPGALFAQRLLRHKNRKSSYQRTFWVIVVIHLSAWGWILLRSGH